ncbi:MAG TPA: PIN domain-containing protein [Candidatus Acidoferrales bacterium]|jgi:predicted nucleic acid-binding protein|nr:PIN domain-containing protein [Candidatus Acidoferrales bacterium]
MSADRVIVDANIAFKCLIKGRGDLRERIGPGGHPQLFTPQFLFVELFKHKERLIRASGLPEDDLLAGIHTLLNQLTFIHEADIPIGVWVEAFRLCKEIDPKDTPYIALTLHMEGNFWTEDQVLKVALRKQNFVEFFEP